MATTDGSSNWNAVAQRPSGMIRVRAPGIQIDVASTPFANGISAFGGTSSPVFTQALVENGFAEFDSLTLTPVASAAPQFGTIHGAGSAEPHIAVELPPPDATAGVVAYLEDELTGGITWLLPVRTGAGGLAPASVISGAPPTLFTFAIPTRLIVPPADPNQLVGIASIRKKILRFLRFDWLVDVIERGLGAFVEWIATRVERRRKTEQLLALDGNANWVPLAERARLTRGRTLVFVHGIFSSVEGAFDGVIKDPVLRAHLQKVYGDRIVGWDHHTVAKDPLENATDMLLALGGPVDVDVVCHSRGGLVIRAALEHSQLRNASSTALRSIGRFVSVAGAHQGSPLARRRNLDKFLDVFTAIGKLTPAAVALEIVFAVLKVFAHGMFDLPGIKVLAPDEPGYPNKFLKDLNDPGMRRVDRLTFVRSNYKPTGGFGPKVADGLIDAVFGQAKNDLVVPFAGAAEVDAIPDIGFVRRLEFDASAGQPNPGVWHTQFFDNALVRGLLGEELS